MVKPLVALLAVALAAVGPVQPAFAQEKARVDLVKVHSPAIAGNLEGNTADRTVYVVTPPGYDQHPEKRYPVVYFLHGYFVEPKAYADLFDLGEALTGAAGAGNEVIFVMPDGFSKHRGSFYSNSPTTGNYEDFVAHDLVEWVDGHYRTLARRESRGLAGHSMGGYGAMRVGMNHPDVFSSLYVMSAGGGSVKVVTREMAERAQADDGTVDLSAPIGGAQGDLAQLAAWSPDPKRPPNFVNAGLLPDGTIDPVVQARMAANSLMGMLPQHIRELKQYEAIMLDVGDKDGLAPDSKAMSAELTRFGVVHTLEVYDGGHGDKVKERLRANVLPFFAAHLDR
ncbi:hypothetical protein SZ64_15345 [Erythrobacter sp. SG61-1L]|uniref:alpha/beta hydrolase n=1 Tax=Erythrobacter sp. SG61-1L TaxID=1603897 RepID=UPI0006C938A2|nr:alpha/beta hydrolase [Erythrobacter sp. SG61-1L]KPL69362.1 hypothetical protein SZ64_15345 [Erythrobacter sp. SG61-1L]